METGSILPQLFLDFILCYQSTPFPWYKVRFSKCIYYIYMYFLLYEKLKLGFRTKASVSLRYFVSFSKINPDRSEIHAQILLRRWEHRKKNMQLLFLLYS